MVGPRVGAAAAALCLSLACGGHIAQRLAFRLIDPGKPSPTRTHPQLHCCSLVARGSGCKGKVVLKVGGGPFIHCLALCLPGAQEIAHIT